MFVVDSGVLLLLEQLLELVIEISSGLRHLL